MFNHFFGPAPRSKGHAGIPKPLIQLGIPRLLTESAALEAAVFCARCKNLASGLVNRFLRLSAPSAALVRTVRVRRVTGERVQRYLLFLTKENGLTIGRHLLQQLGG